MPESISFDRAVEYYDRTRALPEETVKRQSALLDAELRGRGTVLEVGVGTGRVAVTLDVPIVGIDLSRPMMDVLRTKTTTIPLVHGDATRLPFRDACFGGAFAAHVLHLIPTWEDALAEMKRVVRPGGVVLAVRGMGSSEVDREMDLPARVGRTPVGARTVEMIDDGARRLGLAARPLETITRTLDVNLANDIQTIRDGIWSGMWGMTDEERNEVADGVAAWAVERYGSADAVVPATSSFTWHAYDVP
ncbi:MAG: hypothetical protein QOD30_2318 [Actinomycetota bacterium]|nr:hypothetical protein [Actinomycetota bacterium]